MTPTDTEIRHYIPTARQAARRAYRRLSPWTVDREEVEAAAIRALPAAIQRFDRTKSPNLERYVFYFCFRAAQSEVKEQFGRTGNQRARKMYARIDHEHDRPASADSDDEQERKIALANAVEEALKFLPVKQRVAIAITFGLDDGIERSDCEAGRMLGKVSCTIWRNRCRGIKALKRLRRLRRFI